jgi:hypothetical protein
MEGEGKCRSSKEGWEYSGMILEEEKHGKGVHTTKSGRVYKGNFIGNVFAGN